jgi:hypothetical protein
MNITDHVARLMDRGVDLSIRRSPCPWTCVTITLQREDGMGLSLLFSEREIKDARIDYVGMRIDHALQDLG